MSFVEKPSPADEPSSQRPRHDYTVQPLKPGEPIYIFPPPTGYATMTAQQRDDFFCWSQETGRAMAAALDPKKPP